MYENKTKLLQICLALKLKVWKMSARALNKVRRSWALLLSAPLSGTQQAKFNCFKKGTSSVLPLYILVDWGGGLVTRCGITLKKG